MKIAFIGQKGIPTLYGGVERHVEGLACGLAQKGHEVTVYCRNYYTPKVLTFYRGVKLIHLPTISSKHLDAITHTFLATLHALSTDVEIIHYHAVGPALLSFLPRLLKPKVKVVVTFHCLDREHTKWGIIAKKVLAWGEWAACTFPHQTIAVSKTLLNYAKNKFQCVASYIPNSVDVEVCSQENNLGLLKTFKLVAGKYFIVVSRLIPHKNIEEAIGAFITAGLVGYKLVIVGDGFFTDEYVIKLKNLVKDRADIIMTGSQQGEALRTLYRHSLAAIMPSKNEGLSFSLLEALGFGLPAIVRSGAENEEFVKAGVAFGYETEKKLVDLIKDLAQEPAKYLKVGPLAIDYINQHYSLNKAIEQTEDLYKNLLTPVKISQRVASESRS